MMLRQLATIAIGALAIEAGIPALGWAQSKEDRNVTYSAEPHRDADVKVGETVQANWRPAGLTASTAQRAKRAHVKVRTLFAGSGGLPRHLTAIQEAADAYRDAGDESAKEQAKAELLAVIEKYFEEDMVNRQQELAAIEARLEKIAAPNSIAAARRRMRSSTCSIRWPSTKRRDSASPARRRIVRSMCCRCAVFAPPAIDPFRAVPLEPPSPILPTLREGSEGGMVRLLQTSLNKRVKPSPKIDVDSDFGPKTKAAVEKFQSQSGLKPTGVVDGDTWKALGPIERFELTPPQKK